ncbi:MAG: zinc ribbon domain-containing protein, partial [Lachnospiraceae bacterium]|nr:zinc ribbon domain-containing protein [Lachnospiraceae bacterium]
ELANPFAGIARCALCDRVLSYNREANGYEYLKCPNRYCENHAVDFHVFEERVIGGLSDWLSGYRIDWSASLSEDVDAVSAAESAVTSAEKSLTALESQLDRTHNLLEQGVYSTETFLDRSRVLTERIATARENLLKLQDSLVNVRSREANRKNLVPNVEKLIDVYWELPSASAKNEMLKEVLDRVEYRRERKGRKGGPKDDFELKLFPKLPPLSE